MGYGDRPPAWVYINQARQAEANASGLSQRIQVLEAENRRLVTEVNRLKTENRRLKAELEQFKK